MSDDEAEVTEATEPDKPVGNPLAEQFLVNVVEAAADASHPLVVEVSIALMERWSERASMFDGDPSGVQRMAADPVTLVQDVLNEVIEHGFGEQVRMDRGR